MSEYKLLVHSAKQVVLVRDDGARVVRGKDMQKVDVIEAEGEDGINILVDQ